MLWDPSSPSEFPLYILARWLSFSAIVLAIGALVFPRVVRSAVGSWRSAGAGQAAGIDAALGIAARRMLVIAGGLALVAVVFRTIMQRWALNTAFAPDVVPWSDLLWRSGAFSLGVWLQGAGALVALASLALGGSLRAVAAGGAVGMLAIAPGLSGHAAAGTPVMLTLLADALHMVAAGAWIGVLAVIVAFAIPALRATAGADAAPLVAALIAGFSPWALGSFALLGVTGVYAGWRLVGSVDALLSTRYGAALLVKGALIGVIVLFGFLNWRRYGPGASTPSGLAAFRRTASWELGVALAVLLVTAALVGRPSPTE